MDTRIAAIASIVGLVLDICGAFLLAAEAIGIGRIRSWRENLLERPAYILGARKTIEMARRASERRLRWLPRVFVGISCGTGSAVGALLARTLVATTSRSSFWVFGLLAGGLVGAFFMDGVVVLLRWLSQWLVWVDESVGRGTIGVAGFTLLALGFVLQTAAYLPTLLR